MEYKKYGGRVYIRLDKGDGVTDGIREVCEQTGIRSATFSGIGACGDVTVATYLPDKGAFLNPHRSGMLELVSLTGNLVCGENGEPACHAHALFSYLDENGGISFFGGHLRSAVISYTAEIILDPVENGLISLQKDPITGIGIWKFC